MSPCISLTAPAILPLGVDYFPKQEEIDHNFTFSIYNVTLSEFDRKNFASNDDLLMEMVRQRLTQDFQLVSEDFINASNYRRETLRDGLSRSTNIASIESGGNGIVRQFLSLGHRLQVLTYDKSADLIEVTRYNAITAVEVSPSNTYQYFYNTFCQETQSYSKVRQIFSKYSKQYNWNKVDRIICGDDDKEMREGMRFRRLMFGILPENFQNDKKKEADYTAKYCRLLEYFEKLRDKGDPKLDIKLVSSADNKQDESTEKVESTPGLARNSMSRFYIKLKKGKRDNFEWLEVAVDSTFDTSWSYRIMFSWLVASSGKVDAQIQLLQRRCTQYGLNLVVFPQTTVSRNVYLYPFKAPAILTVRDKTKANCIDRSLIKLDFIHDGVFFTDVKSILECIEDPNDFVFGKRWTTSVTGRQFVHRSGTLIVRVLTDNNGSAVLVVVGNYRYMALSKDKTIDASYRKAFENLAACIASLKPIPRPEVTKEAT
jgi:hypothetical protein